MLCLPEERPARQMRFVLYGPALMVFAALPFPFPGCLVAPFLIPLNAQAVLLLWHNKDMTRLRRIFLVLLNLAALIFGSFIAVMMIKALQNPFPNGLG
jgi:hypothetical protein